MFFRFILVKVLLGIIQSINKNKMKKRQKSRKQKHFGKNEKLTKQLTGKKMTLALLLCIGEAFGVGQKRRMKVFIYDIRAEEVKHKTNLILGNLFPEKKQNNYASALAHQLTIWSMEGRGRPGIARK